MIAALLAALLLAPAADPRPPASIDGYPIGGIGRQSLPAKGCAAYLFSTGATRTLVAMAGAEAGTLRIALDGKERDYARASSGTVADLGFAETTRYVAGDTALTLTMTVSRRPDLAQGALVSDATLLVERAGKDGVIMPLAGMIGCAS
ncbi:hypothetical protein SAMN05216382_2856 [Sphingomonas palmae]|uniref:Uncharacterized protein n=1 Tax=Sphingomonas palmae TaxID=1855283 RepID=A0A1H7TYF0_9SPHN|nr:hypothetical protein [Sphingomonas palmae]SEL89488.1 hypothetical protein SAMN05216382_2856 [Sphingomonas palmae]